jgi:hypothetical protein
MSALPKDRIQAIQRAFVRLVLIPAGYQIKKWPFGELCPSAGAVLQFLATIQDLSTVKAS